MRFLLTGKGRSGSWKVRGEQLGSAIGATVQPYATDVRGFDAVVVVKRMPPGIDRACRAARVPMVWDVVDAYPQPDSHTWGRAECISWLRDKFERIRPAAIVAATRQMAKDCEEFGVPVLALPHHARPAQSRNPIRERVRTIGYEGDLKHFGKWREFFESECQRRGWQFVTHPSSMSDLDIVVAMRESDGYASRNWKSNVKLANAQASGTPCVVNGEAGYRETACGAERFADTVDDVRAALYALEPVEVRRAAGAALFGASITLEAVARDYRRWLCEIASKS